MKTFRCPVCHGRETVNVDYLDVPVPCPACENGRVSLNVLFRLKVKLTEQFLTRVCNAVMDTFFGEWVKNRYKEGDE